MTTLKAVTAAAETVERILSNRERETADLTEQIKEAAEAIAEFNKAMEEAIVSGDTQAYQAAKAQRRDAEDVKEMLEARLNALDHKALISRTDYEKAVTAIYEEIEALDDQKKQKLVTLSDQMAAEAMELEEATSKANEVLGRLQHEVYRDADRRRTPNGEVIMISSEEKAVDKWPTIAWGRLGVTSQQYAACVGGEGASV